MSSMPTANSLILSLATSEIGVTEWKGTKHNPEIIEMFAEVGHSWVKDDETAWCAAFVGSILAKCGFQHTGALNARSYLDWGREISSRDVMPGDVVIFWRVSKDSWQGHVGFFVRWEGDRIIVLGGNQDNKVGEDDYSTGQLLGFRRYNGNANLEEGLPLLKKGKRGRFVEDLQSQLKAQGYPIGKVDGHFGNITKAAVLAFQSDNGLVSDGVVGIKTWAALEIVPERELRDVTEEDLRDRNSRTIRTADDIEKKAKQVGGTLVSGGTLDLVLSGASKLQDAESTLGGLQDLLISKWLILLVLGVGFAVWKYGPSLAGHIKAIRVADAVSHNNLGK